MSTDPEDVLTHASTSISPNTEAGGDHEEIIAGLTALTGKLSTEVVAEIARRHAWYDELDAESKSWINVIATNGITNFVAWYSGTADDDVKPSAIFNRAPRQLTRTISLKRTVDLVRTTIDVIERQIGLEFPESQAVWLRTAVLRYSRDVAFASAEVYARAAESRVTWDQRMQALIVDAIMRHDPHIDLVSHASTLGWKTDQPLAVIIGPAPTDASDRLRTRSEQVGLAVLTALHGDQLIIVASPNPGTDLGDSPLDWVLLIEDLFGAGAIIVGGKVDDLRNAWKSAADASAGFRAVRGWRYSQRIVSAEQLMPERVLIGDDRARDRLIHDVYQPLVDSGNELLETAESFLEHNNSVEATARDLFVHANTVRYRLKRIAEVTGYLATEPRDAYVLRLSLSLGRLATGI